MAPSSPSTLHHHRPSSSSLKQQQETQQKQQIRKYLVLLHDCLAIKFLPSLPRVSLRGGDGTNCPNHTVDPSLQGFSLFKEFRDANLSGIWNAVITEAFREISFRGFVLPHTIFISSLPKFMQVIRNAWTRQMIRNPPGYTVHFMGEISEITCDPISQNQWTPLSDSLCWIIHEMTSRGEEAFVETIRASLAQATRLMVQPSRELVYQTLERLTMEQKIYQTSRGYFIVMPGRSCCWRDCSVLPSGQDTSLGGSRSHKMAHRTYSSGVTCSTPNAFSSHSLMTLDALLTPAHQQPSHHQEDRLSCSRHSWDPVSTDPPPRQPEQQPPQSGKKETQRLKRHNSLKFFRQKDNQVKGSLGARSLSLRLSRSRSIPYAGECDSSEQSRGYESQLTSQIEDDKESQSGDKLKNKKGKSLLSKLFGWTRSSSKKKKKSTPVTSTSDSLAVSNSLQSQLGSSNGLGLNSDYYLDTKNQNPLDNCDMESGCFTLDSRHHSQRDHHHHYSELGLTNLRWDSLPKRSYRNNSSRRSILTLAAEEDVGSLYVSPGHHKTVSGSELSSPPICPSQNLPPSPFHNHQRPPSGRSSTSFSQGTSLGYGSGSQGPHTESHSPCPSLSTTTTTTTTPNNITNGSYATISNHNSSKHNYQRRYSGSNSVYSPIFLRSDTSPVPSSINSYDGSSRPLYETIVDRKGLLAGVGQVKDNNSKEKTAGGTEPSLTQQKKLEFGGGTTTTTLTQNVTSRTNLELEVSVPLGGKLRVGNNNENNDGHRNNHQDMSVSIGNTEIRLEGVKGDNNVGGGGREVKTVVNQNGIIETHFDCGNGQVKSTIKIVDQNNTNNKSNNE